MKGTDLTDAQIQSAREFSCARQVHQPADVLDDATRVTLKFGELVRLIAWYGALRFQAGRDGTGGTFENPGPMDTSRKAQNA